VSRRSRRLGFGRRSETAQAVEPNASDALLQAGREERRYNVLVEPHITEKVTQLGDTSNHCAFKVAPDATKAEIKRAVETLFDVKVANVTTLNVKGKVKRTLRYSKTKLKDWKKAYVRLEAGENIDFTSLES